MKKIERKTYMDRIIFYGFVWVIALIAPLIITGVNHGNLINSDDSSEMVLAEILSHKNFVFDPWMDLFHRASSSEYTDY